jgi:hypothetical protein
MPNLPFHSLQKIPKVESVGSVVDFLYALKTDYEEKLPQSPQRTQRGERHLNSLIPLSDLGGSVVKILDALLLFRLGLNAGQLHFCCGRLGIDRL